MDIIDCSDYGMCVKTSCSECGCDLTLSLGGCGSPSNECDCGKIWDAYIKIDCEDKEN